MLFRWFYCRCWSVAKSCPTLCNPMDTRLPCAPLSPRVCSNHARWVDDAIQPSHPLSPLFLLPSTFPRVFSIEAGLRIRCPKCWSFSFSISPSDESSGLISLQSKGLSRVFSSTTVQKHQFFGTQPSLWSNYHIHTWLLENPQLWLYAPLLVKWCLCFLICCLVLS